MSDAQNNRLQTAIARFDELNTQDPNKITVEGVLIAKELYDAKAMSRWVEKLYPDANEGVKLAARCQHLCRWKIPRSSYPTGRNSYLKWRNDLKKFHADNSTAVLKEVGYENEIIDQVRVINLKKGLNNNPDVQAIEDALCMVFLETQLEGYLNKWDSEKVISILQKTWVKMSPRAKEAALGLTFSERAKGLVEQALS